MSLSTKPFVFARRVLLLVSTLVLAGSNEGCGGKSARSRAADHTTGGSSGGDSESGAGGNGAAAASGNGNQGGSDDGNQGGSADGGSAAQPTGGSGGDQPPPGGAGGAGPPDECELTRARCFEPCDGDPSGNWVLESACFLGSDIEGCPGGRISGTARDMQMSMSLRDSVVPLVNGRVTWEIVANVPPSCLGLDSVDACGTGQIFIGPTTGPLHSSPSRMWLPDCEPTACGVCDCSAEGEDSSLLNLPLTTHCVDGDVLWLGGLGKNGEAKVSYKFRRRSCTGTRVPCAERTIAQCALGGDCRLGRCSATTSNAAQCPERETQADCDPMDGCTWLPEECTGSAHCNFLTCEQVPGCSLGPAAPPRCGGSARCGGHFARDNCHEPGCSVRSCSGETGPVSCGDLDESTCPLAPGCSWSDGGCTGTTLCAEQSDEFACHLLADCDPRIHCGGTPIRVCSDLSVEACHSLRGCVIEW